MAIDYTTDIGKIRALTGDVDEANFRMSDAEITAILGISSNNILLSAAQTAEAMAMKVTMELGNIKTLDFQSDAAKMAQTFMSRANELRTQYSEGGFAEDDIEFVEITGNPYYHPRLEEY